MTGPVLTAGAVPVGPMLSMFDPIFVGINEFGLPHYTRVIYKNLLAAGEPGGGKSGLLNTLAAHAALSAHSRTVPVRRQASRTRHVGRHRRRIRRPRHAQSPHHAAAAPEGDGQPERLAGRSPPPQDRTRRRPERHHLHLLRDRRLRHRARHRARTTAVRLPAPRPGGPGPQRRHAGHRRHPAAIGGHHPQEPARPVRPPRAAFRCTSTGSSDIILGDGLSAAGSQPPTSPRQPRRTPAHRRRRRPERGKAAYLSDADIIALADYAAWTRRTGSLPTAGPATAVA